MALSVLSYLGFKIAPAKLRKPIRNDSSSKPCRGFRSTKDYGRASINRQKARAGVSPLSPSIYPCPTHSVREESRRERERETWSDLGSQSPRSKIPREEGGLEPSVDLRSSFPSLRSVNPRRSRYVDSADCGVIQGHRETLPDKWQGKGSS